MEKRGRMKLLVLLFVVAMICSCATPPKGPHSDMDSAEDFYLRGMKEFKKGDYDEAASDFKTAVKMDPKYIKAYYALGQANEKMNKIKEAEDAYEQAVKIKSDYLPAREALGLICFRQKKFVEAEKSLEIASKHGSTLPEVYYSLGQIDQRENECKDAIVNYKKALKLDPDYLPAQNGLKAPEKDCKPSQQPKSFRPR
jgi:Tfp pilus assembly protein PilF